LPPKQAFDLESGQIAELGLFSMVSLTDHDNLNAPILLRSLPSAHSIPLSVEWTAPYGDQAFHLGVHNLPASRAVGWMEILAEFTRNPGDERLSEILAALDAEPHVLVVFNHPMWDLYMVGRERHLLLVNEFIRKYGAWLHAIELNGLRGWEENRAARDLAERWDFALISGGDRHGAEPNANVNLTNAATFCEFVQEIRLQGKSNVLFMPQYAEPLKHRMLRSAVDAVRHYPDFPEGSRRWDERVYHPDGEGISRSLRELWPDGNPPLAMRLGIGIVRCMGRGLLSQGLRMAWSDSHRLGAAVGEPESSDA
jgi:hypothetical protein